jgi:hypothetical protein
MVVVTANVTVATSWYRMGLASPLQGNMLNKQGLRIMSAVDIGGLMT